MKIQLRNIHTGKIVSYEDYDILVFNGDNDETLITDEFLPDFIDQHLEAAE
jgi:hypothetical protein